MSGTQYLEVGGSPASKPRAFCTRPRIYIIGGVALGVAVVLSIIVLLARRERQQERLTECGSWAPQPIPVEAPAGVKAMKDHTDIPTCGKAQGWNCRDHPLLEPESYCNAIKAGSDGTCPVEVNHDEFVSLYALMHYFLPGNTSYSDNHEPHHTAYTTTDPTDDSLTAPRRDSWGYQYYSLEHSAFRWDQIFYLDFDYDHASETAKPGAQMMETARASNKFLIDVNLGNGPGIGVLDRDDRGVGAVCAYIPEGMWQLMKSRDLSNPNVTTYCGTTHFPQGYFSVGTNFDVYMVKDRWFFGVPIFWYVNRDNGMVAAQLYYQSGGITQSQNYMWDFSRRLFSTKIAREMFRRNPHYYFDINEDMLKRACGTPEAQIYYGRDVVAEVLANSFPDKACCGPPNACVPC